MTGPDVAKYALGVPATLTGTVSINGTAAVTGTSTDFINELAAYDVAIINGQTVIVASITNSALFLSYPDMTGTASGLSVQAYNLHTTLLQRNIPFPKGIFTPYSQPLDLGDGSLRGAGWPTAEWQWGYLTRAQRDALRTLMDPSGLGLASAPMFLKTTQNETADEYAVYSGQMLWPQTEQRSATRRVPFSVRFRALSQLSPLIHA